MQRPFRSSNSTMAKISHILGQENRGIQNFMLSQVGGGLREWRSPEARGADEIRPGP